MSVRPAEGSFYWCVARLDLGQPTLTAIARGVCSIVGVWPEQLLGRAGAGDAVSLPDAPPLSGAHDRSPHVVHARRLCWALARELTTLSAAEVGEAFGGHAAATVRQHWHRPTILTVGRDLRVVLVP